MQCRHQSNTFASVSRALRSLDGGCSDQISEDGVRDECANPVRRAASWQKRLEAPTAQRSTRGLHGSHHDDSDSSQSGRMLQGREHHHWPGEVRSMRANIVDRRFISRNTGTAKFIVNGRAARVYKIWRLRLQRKLDHIGRRPFRSACGGKMHLSIWSRTLGRILNCTRPVCSLFSLHTINVARSRSSIQQGMLLTSRRTYLYVYLYKFVHEENLCSVVLFNV